MEVLLQRWLYTRFLQNCALTDGSVSEESLSSAIELANQLIFFKSQQDRSLSGMGTTVVALAVLDSKVNCCPCRRFKNLSPEERGVLLA